MKFTFSLDWVTFISALGINLLSVFTLLSLSEANVSSVPDVLIYKHVLFIIVGLFLGYCISQLDYQSWSTASRTLFYTIVILLILVLFLGSTINGAKSWFTIAGFGFQPAEFAKIVTIIVMAKYLTTYHRDLYSLFTIFISFLPIAVIGGLIAIQPDFGSASIIAIIWVGMVFFGGIRWEHIMILLSTLVVSLSIIWLLLLQPYQKQRILTFFDPYSDPLGAGYNTLQVLDAVSGVGLFGRQFNPIQPLIPIPEIQTDFIFAGFTQTWGLIGVSIYLSLLTLILGRILYMIFKIPHTFGRLMLIGIFFTVLGQSWINIAMNIGLLPITGIPLPLLSYGGSSMITTWILLGLVSSISSHTRITYQRSYDIESII